MSTDFQIIQGNSLNVLPTLEAESVDSCVTDPPYELGFMGKAWDSTGIAYNVDLWRAVYRVLKPGAYLLAFGGSRTYHRMACAIEDAGFEIRDQIQWIYGSGFPKSLDVSKAIDKHGGQYIGWFIPYVLEVAAQKGVTKKQLQMLFPSRNGNPTGWLHNKQNTQSVTADQFNKLRDFLDLPFASIEEAERVVVGQKITNLTPYQRIGQRNESGTVNVTVSASAQAKTWEGWGTALKPAHEPIVMARKPLEKGLTVAQNVLKWGTGAINIDACRVETDDSLAFGSRRLGDGIKYGKCTPATEGIQNSLGRFPANVIHDGSDEVEACFPEANNHGHGPKARGNGGISCNGHSGQTDLEEVNFLDFGSASRFFYSPKASKYDREAGLREAARPTMGNGIGGQPNQQIENNRNHHPTVKPTDLMQYLCRLVTPPGGRVLDPFLGSGSTAKAALIERLRIVGIELNPEYAEIAEARCKQLQVNLFI